MNATSAITHQEKAAPTSWGNLLKAPIHFVTTFVEPFMGTESHEFYRRQFVELRDDVMRQGVLGYIGTAVRERPLDVLGKIGSFCAVGSAHFGNVLGNGTQFALSLVKTAGAYAQQVEFLKGRTASIGSHTLLGKGVKLVVLLSLPLAVAGGWNSLADAKDYYDGGPCAESIANQMTPIKHCIEEHNGNVQNCIDLVPQGCFKAFSVFTRHASPDANPDAEPVSIVTYEERTCVISALGSKYPVTKICFTDLNDLDSRTVEELPSMPLARAHQHLQSGQTVMFFEFGLTVSSSVKCAYNFPVHPDNAAPRDVCLLTALENGEQVSQICFSKDNLAALTLKPLSGIKLNQQNPKAGPISIVVDPAVFRLNTAPVSEVPSIDQSLCPDAEKIAPLWDRLWGALNWIWTGKSPCDKTGISTPKKDEL